MAPLDVTARLQLETAQRARIFARATPLTQALKELYSLWGQPTPTLHDPMAVSLLLNSKLCKMEQLAIRIDDLGMTHVMERSRVNATVATEGQPERFIAFYQHRLAP
jgi:inosine-uridine nucleoside N-ribohydrolase